jgi:hypothetical protein
MSKKASPQDFCNGLEDYDNAIVEGMRLLECTELGDSDGDKVKKWLQERSGETVNGRKRALSFEEFTLKWFTEYMDTKVTKADLEKWEGQKRMFEELRQRRGCIEGIMELELDE